ncbi:hypothetical protein PGSY75_1108100 [Plasmodium gaboni]|uniref:Uncharacterized protein n=1 Tax=Plasmodium gaboni TaxID=647221 RepID=A0A151LIB8_9APIC|nr:hypothetical protein PGSY75_1108100 [Plasmodium gaboni]KYN98725.1 hypothetical protein PGSY75_1108100 [Plasmodium gaboni]
MNPEEDICNKKSGVKDQALKHFLYQNILKKNFILFNIFKGGKDSNNDDDISNNKNEIEDMSNISKDINNNNINNDNNVINRDRNINDTSNDINYTNNMINANNLCDISIYNNNCNIYENNKNYLFDNDYSKLIEENDEEVCSFYNVHNNNNIDDDIILNNDDEEYILFLKYIYNDLLCFIESNKDYHLNNSNYSDMEDLIIDICGTICHKAFNNIKTIFNTYDDIKKKKKKKNTQNLNSLDNCMLNEENIYDEKYINNKNEKIQNDMYNQNICDNKSNVNYSSYFFIPPLEFIVSHLNKLHKKNTYSYNDIDEFVKNNGYDKYNLLSQKEKGNKSNTSEEIEFYLSCLKLQQKKGTNERKNKNKMENESNICVQNKSHEQNDISEKKRDQNIYTAMQHTNSLSTYKEDKCFKTKYYTLEERTNIYSDKDDISYNSFNNDQKCFEKNYKNICNEKNEEEQTKKTLYQVDENKHINYLLYNNNKHKNKSQSDNYKDIYDHYENVCHFKSSVLTSQSSEEDSLKNKQKTKREIHSDIFFSSYPNENKDNININININNTYNNTYNNIYNNTYKNQYNNTYNNNDDEVLIESRLQDDNPDVISNPIQDVIQYEDLNHNYRRFNKTIDQNNCVYYNLDYVYYNKSFTTHKNINIPKKKKKNYNEFYYLHDEDCFKNHTNDDTSFYNNNKKNIYKEKYNLLANEENQKGIQSIKDEFSDIYFSCNLTNDIKRVITNDELIHTQGDNKYNKNINININNMANKYDDNKNTNECDMYDKHDHMESLKNQRDTIDVDTNDDDTNDPGISDEEAYYMNNRGINIRYEYIKETKNDNMGDHKDDSVSYNNDDNVSDHKDDNVSDHKDDNVSNHKDDNVSDHKDDNVSNHNDDNMSSHNDDNMSYHNDDNMSDNNYNDDDKEEEHKHSSKINFMNNINSKDGNDYKEIINNDICKLNNVKEEDECNIIKESYDIQSDADNNNNNNNINDEHKIYNRHIYKDINDNEEGSKNILKINEEEYQKKLQKILIKKKTIYENQDQRNFIRNENLHDDYYYFKYLNNKENTTDPYHYTKGDKKTNIQVTPSPFPQFLRDIQIYNIPQKKIRLKRTSIPLKHEGDKNKEQKYIYNKTKKKDRKKERSISVVREKNNE